jgi:hypothetical protein
MRRAFAIACAGTVLGAGALRLTAPQAPPFEAVRVAHGPSEARLLDRHGTILDARRCATPRRRLEWTTLAAIARACAAVIAAEDRASSRAAASISAIADAPSAAAAPGRALSHRSGGAPRSSCVLGAGLTSSGARCG